MATLREIATGYKPNVTKNISELEKVPTDATITEKEFNKEDGTTFKVNVINVGGEDYRVPTQVVQQLQQLLLKKPKLKFFSVAKSGEGLKTSYMVVAEE